MKCIGCKRQGDEIGGKGELRCLRHRGDQPLEYLMWKRMECHKAAGLCCAGKR